jgi:RNA polymerase sigma factor (sigma-70 family)
MSSVAAHHPFAVDYDAAVDSDLIDRAVSGDRDALTALVSRHQPFVFNLAVRMFGSRPEAEDLTQQVLVKMVTSLQSFRGEAAFRTWLYRMTVNQFLRSKPRGMEVFVGDFSSYFAAIEDTPDEGPNEPEPLSAGSIDELRYRCTSGMLMCLDRMQRITFILGDIFGVNHRVGAEILGVSPGNFRVRLTRARKDLSMWMHNRCGLVNTDNPCRCANKTRAHIHAGTVDPKNLMFASGFVERVSEHVSENADETMELVSSLHRAVFRDHPMHLSATDVVTAVLRNKQLQSFFEI